MTWPPLLRDADGTIVLEEADEDTRTAIFRVYGARARWSRRRPMPAVRIRRRGVPPSCAPRSPRLSSAASSPRAGSDVKPAPFEYVAARSVEEALAALAVDGARVLAGGQSLVPLLNLRAVRPRGWSTSTGAGLGVIRRRDGVLELGATVRQAALERSRADRRALAAAGARRSRTSATPRRARAGPSAARSSTPTRAPSSPPRSPRSTRASSERARCSSRSRCRRCRRARGRRTPSTRGRAACSPTRARPSCSRRATRGSRCWARAARAARRGGAAGRARARARPPNWRPSEVEGDHRRALVADVTRRALDRGGAAMKRPHQRTSRTRRRGRAAHPALGLHPRPGPHRHEGRLRAGGVRGVHGAARRRARALVPDARRPGRRVRRAHDRGLSQPGPLQRSFHEHHALQCGFCTAGFLMTLDAYLRRAPRPDRGSSSRRRWPGTCAAARATRRSSRRC